LKRFIDFINSIIPNRKRFNSWSKPTKIAVLASAFLVVTYFIDKLIDYYKKEPFNSETNYNEKIFVFESNKENFEISFGGRLSNISIGKLYINEDKLERNIKINLDYTGYYKALNTQSDISNYSGGHIVIKFESCTLNFSEFYIPPMGPAPKNILISQVEEGFSKILFENKDLIKKKIEICLKDIL
jgi:hypothetical protein